MTAGQSFTTWFPELKKHLKENWSFNLAIEEQFNLLADLNNKLKQIRAEKNIQPPMVWCPKCKEKHIAGFIDISINGLYFALKRFEICSEDDFNELRKKWKKYSTVKNIDIYGKTINKHKNKIDNH